MLKLVQNTGFISLAILFLSCTTFSQTAKKTDELDYLYCGGNFRFDLIYENELKDDPMRKVYIIYYEGPREYLDFSYKTRKYFKVVENPKFGNALNRAKEIPLYLKMVYKVANNRVVLIDGGFRERFVMEIWSVPQGAEIPKPTPTLTRKDIKFAKGEPQKTRSMACCYESC